MEIKVTLNKSEASLLIAKMLIHIYRDLFDDDDVSATVVIEE